MAVSEFGKTSEAFYRWCPSPGLSIIVEILRSHLEPRKVIEGGGLGYGFLGKPYQVAVLPIILIFIWDAKLKAQ